MFTSGDYRLVALQLNLDCSPCSYLAVIMKRSKKTVKKKPRKKAVQLSEELVTLYKDVFQRFDKEGCGTISKSGLEKVMRTLGQDTSEEKLKELIKQYDKHGNGYITYEDFMARMSERSNPDDVTEEDIREVFDVFDTEGNGSIGIDNFWETMTVLGYDITKEEAVDIFKAGDEDEDGRVNFDDFTRMLQRENVL